jgi:hypothetical protein
VDDLHVDVPTAVTSALRGAGVDRVAVWPDCTCCDDRYFSRRRTPTTGRQGAFAGIRPDVTRWEHLRSRAASGRTAAARRVGALRVRR